MPLFTFNTVEGFYKYWLRTPHITCVCVRAACVAGRRGRRVARHDTCAGKLGAHSTSARLGEEYNRAGGRS